MSTQREDQHRKIRVCWRVIFMAFALLLGGAYTVYRLGMKARFRSMLEDIRKAGYPATLEELNAWYEEPPPGQNAADVYEEAFRALVEPTNEQFAVLPVFGLQEPLPPGEPLAPELKEAIASYLAQNERALQFLHKAARMEKCRYAMDLSQIDAMLWPPTYGPRYASRLLFLEAILNAEKKNAEGTATSIRTMIALAGSLRDEPILISQLVREAVVAMGLGSLEWTLQKVSFTDEQLAGLSPALRGEEETQGMMNAMVGERCTASYVASMPARRLFALSSPGPLMPNRPNLLGKFLAVVWPISGIWDMDCITCLSLMNEAVAAWGEPLPQRLRTAKAVSNKADKKVQRGWLHPFTALLLPDIRRTAEREALLVAMCRCARAALAIERFGLKHGRWPDSLEQVKTEYLDGVPEDPFDGKPLRYKKLEKGYLVYSIGTDGVDNGGALDKERRGPDSVFKVVR